MKWRRRWQVAYRCEFFKMNIIERMSFCKEPNPEDKKCTRCSYRGNEDGKKETPNDS